MLYILLTMYNIYFITESVGYGAWSYFSAVCWEYGRHIQKSLGYPIGMISTTWGGTPVEAWSSPDALKKCGIHAQTPDMINHE